MTKVIGVIGGMGPLASLDFYGKVIHLTEASRDQDHLHIIVDSDASIPDRTGFLLGRGEDPRPGIVASAKRLVSAGARLLVMPCNTAAVFSSEIEAAARVPLVDWIDAAVDRLEAVAARRVGILATSGTIDVGLYQHRLKERSIEWLVPDDAGQDAIMETIYGDHGVKAGVADDVTRNGLLGAAKELARRGADVLVLGCTELPLAVPEGDPHWPVPAVDPAWAVARRAIDQAGGRVVGGAG